jgi:hypothetical protein
LRLAASVGTCKARAEARADRDSNWTPGKSIFRPDSVTDVHAPRQIIWKPQKV